MQFPKIRWLATIASVGALAACSPSLDTPEFSTDGVTAPASHCSEDPRGFSDAESMGTLGSGACSAANMWKINTIEGVRLSQPALVNCSTANALRGWLTEKVQPAARAAHGAIVTDLTVAASYACRPRNGQRGAKLSEHGLGNAIDVSGLTLSNGKTLEVEQDYYRSTFLKRIRAEACGVFKTVLGPGSDASHGDHFHFDLANRRSGQSYCR